MLNSSEKIIYLIMFVAFTVIRQYYTSKYKDTKVKKNKKNTPDTILLSLTGIAMLVPLVYVFSGVLDFADYIRPFWVSIIGVFILIIASICLWLSHRDLSSNWTPMLGIKNDHKLVTKGIYKYLRHPMYAAHIYWAVGQIFLLPNWIAGFSLILFSILLPLLRIKDEEKMMVDEFGDEYKVYKNNTGRFFPKIF